MRHGRPTPTGAIALNFGMVGDIADVIIHAKFYVNRFRGFGVLTPPILPFSIGLAGRPYNSESITVLHCDYINFQSYLGLAVQFLFVLMSS